MTALLLTAAAAFIIGFLLGDRRGVKQANAILDENQRVLFSAIRDEKIGHSDAFSDEDRPAAPTMH